MLQLTVQTIASAPSSSTRTLQKAERSFGFLPNLLGVFANAPAALDGYMGVAAAFQSSSFSAAERQTVLLATSVENGCTYCVAAHSTIAGMEDVPAETISELRQGGELSDPRLEALRVFTTAVVRERGWVEPSTVESFLVAGFTQAQVLEVVLGVTQKTLSNYVNHLAQTPLDEAFRGAEWAGKKAATAA